MHIPDAELFDVALGLRERLAVGGKLLVSMPESRPDVSPGASRDSRGRLMIVRSVAQLGLLFEHLAVGVRGLNGATGPAREVHGWEEPTGGADPIRFRGNAWNLDRRPSGSDSSRFCPHVHSSRRVHLDVIVVYGK